MYKPAILIGTLLMVFLPSGCATYLLLSLDLSLFGLRHILEDEAQNYI
jgi:hypothetical protein